MKRFGAVVGLVVAATLVGASAASAAEPVKKVSTLDKKVSTPLKKVVVPHERLR